MSKPPESLWLGNRRNIVVILRLIVFFIIYLIIFQERGLRDMPPAFWVVTVAFMISELACLFEHKTYFFVQRILGWIFVFDAILISLLIYFLAVESSQLFIGYFAVIAIASISKSVRASFVITFLVSAFYLFAAVHAGNFAPLEFLTRALFFFGVAIFASYLSEEVSVQYKRKEELEKVMGESEQKYLNIIANPLVGVYQSTLKGDFIYANEALATMLGYDSPRELMRVPVINIYRNPETRTLFINELRKNGYVRSFENELITRSGLVRNMLINGTLNEEVISGVIMDITERKQAESRYRLLAENVADVIWTTDLNYRFTYLSPSVASLLGYNVDEAMHLKLTDLLPETSLQAAMEAVQKALETRKRTGTIPPEYRTLRLEHIRKDKSVIWVEINGDFISGADGNPAGIIGVTRDITKQKTAEELLRQSEERYHSLFVNMMNGFAYCRMLYQNNRPDDFVYLDVNKSFENLTGLKNVVGRKVSEVIPGIRESNRELFEIYGRVALTGRPEQFETYVEPLKMWFSISVYSPQKEHFVAIFDVITERKKSEDVLKQSEQRLKVAETLGKIGNWEFDIAANKIEWSDEVYKIYERDRKLGPPTADEEALYYTPEEVRRLRDFSRRAIETGEEFRYDTCAKLPSGRVVYLSASMIPVKDAKGLVAKLFGTVQDVTGRKKLEDQLLQSQRMEVIGRLAGGIAHDFNNILAVIGGYTELILGDSAMTDSLRDDVREIDKAAKRATTLTGQLLAFSRKQMLQKQDLDLNSLIADMNKMLVRIIGEDIELVTNLTPDNANIEADPVQIEQAIMNLAVNARDAMPDGGKLDIKTERLAIDEQAAKLSAEARPGEFICLSIRDSGVGMGREIKDHLFEPFFTTKEKGKGTGLGLATVYGIIKQHEGWISISSEPGQGTLVRICLPASKSSAKRKPDTRSLAPDKLKGSGERILVVEDQKEMLDFVALALEKNGYKVFRASNAEEALGVFNRERGDIGLVFSDVVLPGQTGIELVAKIVSLKPSQKVILTSGYMDEKSQWSIIRQKGYKFLQKPYPIHLLFAAVKETLDAGLENT